MQRLIAPGQARVSRWLCLLSPLLLLGCGPADPLAEVRKLHATGRFEQSLEPLRGLVESRGDEPEVHLLYGLALTRSGQASLAFWPLRKAMESTEWMVRAGTQLAAAALIAGNYDIAVDAATRVLEQEPDNDRVLVLRALARVHSRRDYEGAIADADRAIALDPDNFEALIPRAVALLGLERVEEAEAALDEIDARFREESLGLESTETYCTARASFAKERGELETAEQIYGQCLERYPSAYAVGDFLSLVDAYNRAIYELSVTYSVPIVDLKEIFMDRPEYRSLFVDTMHPSYEGYAIVARNIRKVLYENGLLGDGSGTGE